MIYALLLRPFVALLNIVFQFAVAVFTWSPFSQIESVTNYVGRPESRRLHLPTFKIYKRDRLVTVVVLLEMIINGSIIVFSYFTSIVSWFLVHNILLVSLVVVIPYNLVRFVLHEFLGRPVWLIKQIFSCVILIKNWLSWVPKCFIYLFNPLSLLWPKVPRYQLAYWIGQSKIYKSCFVLFLITYSYLLSCEARNYATSVVTSFIFLMPVYLL